MRFVVVGGGVAGVCCAQELGGICPADSIHIVSADKSLKSVSITARLSPNLELLQLEEKRLDDFPTPNVHFVHDAAVGLDHENKILHLDSGGTIQYDKLCIATGGQPRRLSCAESDLVLTLRDVDSIDALAARLKTARRVGIIGNGGIALELVYVRAEGTH
ncbi:hypothetical protein H632_c1951p1 [Helicosporidium sp. ATCC 50920]|nr:hypothetical protein H632_c1951p1 [Helicosporidium sp. ATCC 50920]|eukprot:KDD73665.1 hypothetical protein H632_c1951p1 [Helicosporidium sp. ATCC 50920]